MYVCMQELLTLFNTIHVCYRKKYLKNCIMHTFTYKNAKIL